MFHVRVCRTLGCQGGFIIGKAAFAECFGVNDRHNAINRHLRLDIGPVEGAYQRLGQGQTRGFNNDVIKALGAVQKLFHRWHKIISYRAADATIGKFDDVIFSASIVIAGFEYFSIHADIAKFIDDEGDLASICILQKLADQSCFACTKEASNHCRWNFGCHDAIIS